MNFSLSSKPISSTKADSLVIALPEKGDWPASTTQADDALGGLIKKLQKAGYITGYAAQVDMAKLGETLTVFTEFTLRNHRQIDFARFQEALEQVECCVECHLVSGGYDYLAKFVTASISDYQTIVEELIDRDVGIDKYFSFVVMKTPFSKTRMPLTHLFADKV